MLIGVIVALQGCSLFDKTKVKGSSADASALAYQLPPLLQFELPAHEFELNPLFSWDRSDKSTSYLLKQGHYYSNLKEPYRLKVCNKLATIYQSEGVWQAGWLLAYSFSDKKSCITHNERLKILKELEKLIDLNKQIKWLNSAQIQTLESINYLKARNAQIKEQLNNTEIELDQSRAESQMLKTQIKELKAVETMINERISDEKP